jgi:hypothetical protein|tara:strand:- start:417 stop:560 length:144 start_codon:yes stop_codon:yes gene_type:complete
MLNIGKRWMISFYSKLLSDGKIKTNGSAYNRLVQLMSKFTDEKKSKN